MLKHGFDILSDIKLREYEGFVRILAKLPAVALKMQIMWSHRTASCKKPPEKGCVVHAGSTHLSISSSNQNPFVNAHITPPLSIS